MACGTIRRLSEMSNRSWRRPTTSSMRPGRRLCTIAIHRTSFDSNWGSINQATVQTHNRYTRAASTLRDWLKSGALKRDAQPTLYYHTIEYTPPSAPSGSPTKTLKGFLATVKLEALDSGHYLPAREYTLGRQNRSAESARSLQDELQPHLVALLRPSRSGDGPAGSGRSRGNLPRSTFATMWGSVSNSGL